MNKTPNHVAIIMDGNGRWATEKGMVRTEGHKKGAETLEKLAVHILNSGTKYLSVYAFSTDNFKRPETEVSFLMNLFIKMFKTKMEKIIKNDIKVVFSGRKENLREDVLDAMNTIVEKSKNNKKGTLNICLNYGSQEEIVDATKRIVKDVQNGIINIDDIDKEMYYKYMYRDLPPIDLMIRTSGEQRLSNFMLYQLTYSELYFTDTYFPDFDEKEYDKAMDAFNNRDRRFGKVKDGSEKK
ncbi:MAG: di-trans,poly-cis-decaprenylcistransferase [Bacilli bacterium]|nr:di-trans,poly-cis-decaprenylcistransferase [Bacilli bacterium]